MIRIVECCVCNKMSRANLMLDKMNICSGCEAKMLAMKADHRDYIRYREGMKRLVRALIKV
ncbi:MAG TPA: sigma factor G inhibitor Gin [Clostridia bacterium]|nr:sigma factor G inhibitor Gin [Clostridia bacterium]